MGQGECGEAVRVQGQVARECRLRFRWSRPAHSQAARTPAAARCGDHQPSAASALSPPSPVPTPSPSSPDNPFLPASHLQVIPHQHVVGGLDGNVGAAADGHPHVRCRQGRAVVYAVAHHGHRLARALQLPDLRGWRVRVLSLEMIKRSSVGLQLSMNTCKRSVRHRIRKQLVIKEVPVPFGVVKHPPRNLQLRTFCALVLGSVSANTVSIPS